MIYAKKISLSIDAGDILNAERELIQTTDKSVIGRYRHANWIKLENEPTPLLMYKLQAKVSDRVIAQLPKKLLDVEIPGVYLMIMEKPEPTPSVLPPHIDRGRRSTINIYLECDDEETQFYEADEDTKALTYVESFTAKAGEAWAMDVSQPHSVIMNKAMRRSGLSLSFRKIKYDRLVSLL
jgi:hypothetical protein